MTFAAYFFISFSDLRNFQLRTLWVVTLCFPVAVRHSACQLLRVLTSRKAVGENIVKRDNGDRRFDLSTPIWFSGV